MNTLLNSLLGQNAEFPGSAHQQSAAQYSGPGLLSGQLHPGQYSSAQQNAIWNNQTQAYMQQTFARLQHRFQIDGVSMDLKQFVETLCPDPEDPWRSHLLLKYAGRDA
jgi:hypothetical protein